MPTKILLRHWVGALRDDAWDVLFVAESWPGILDEAVLQKARRGSRILLTEDKDFGELIFRMQLNSHGVLLLRLQSAPWHAHWSRLSSVLHEHAEQLLHAFTVVEDKKVRFRPMDLHRD